MSSSRGSVALYLGMLGSSYCPLAESQAHQSADRHPEGSLRQRLTWGVPKISGPFLEVLRERILVYWGPF